MKTIEDAIILAATAHRGQVDKAGEPYICHPLRLMLEMTTEVQRMTAVLHDVVEDSDTTLEDLTAAGYPAEVLAALQLLTHDDDTPYMDYVRALRPNALALTVKLADLHDNMDMSRIADPTEKDFQRLEKYREALEVLMDGVE